MVAVLGSVAMGLGVGDSSVIARAMGEGDHHKVKKTNHQLAREIASLFNGDSAVVAIAAAYLTIVPISFAAYGIFLISSSTFNALMR